MGQSGFFGPWTFEIASGVWRGSQVVSKFGSNPSISGTEFIWSTGGAYTWPVVADTITVVSGAAADTAAGAGMRTLRVYGLDENFEEVTEDLTLAGVTPVVGTQLFTRVFRAHGLTAGTYDAANTGLITVTHTTSTDTLATIDVEIGQTQISAYTVPAGRRAHLSSLRFSVGSSNDGVHIRFYQRQNADSFSSPSPNRLVSEWLDVIGQVDSFYHHAVTFPEKTDIFFTGEKAGVGGNPACSVEFTLVVTPE
jgi:hypothetical protein